MLRPLARRAYYAFPNQVSRLDIRLFSGTARVAADSASNPPELVLYQYKICPFCNISKSFLSFANVDYKAVEVNPLTKSEIKWYGFFASCIFLLLLMLSNHNSS